MFFVITHFKLLKEYIYILLLVFCILKKTEFSDNIYNIYKYLIKYKIKSLHDFITAFSLSLIFAMSLSPLLQKYSFDVIKTF